MKYLLEYHYNCKWYIACECKTEALAATEMALWLAANHPSPQMYRCRIRKVLL